ncbi:hypothetical protein [Flavobacterium beibuense]|uniref:hypothetical protein n=1 Tax=Flavobacterium beibuense TaxID=657326 RepID=UPI003A8DAAF8
MIVISNQSILDVAIQESGSVLTAFEWALKNGKSITEILTPGTELNDPLSSLTDVDVKAYFKATNRKLATTLTAEQMAVIVPDEGIGAMIIEDSFIVY